MIDLPTSIMGMVQDGTLEQMFQDTLLPNMLFVDDADQEPFVGHLGTEITETRPGLLQVVSRPLKAGEEPQPQSYLIEQWKVRVDQYAGRVDTDLMSAGFTIRGKFLNDVETLAKQAGMSTNRLVRNQMYNAYTGGDTVLDYTIGGDPGNSVTHRVAALAGLRYVLVNGALVGVSATYPLACTIGGVARNITGVPPDDVDFPDGPGSITISVAINSARIFRAQNATTIDGIAAGDTHTFADLLAISAYLGNIGVPKHPDGTYHVHADDFAMANLFQDPQLQNVIRGQVASMEWKQGIILRALGFSFILNNQCPLSTSVTTGELFSAPLTNATGVAVHRLLVTGMGMLKEKRVNEEELLRAEFGEVQHRIGSFPVRGKQLAAALNGVRYVIAPPIDVLAQKVRQAWSMTRGWGVPSDFYNHAGIARLYMRGAVYEAAGA